jgi:hypothetical protein
MARLSDREQGGVPRGSCRSGIKKSPDLRGGRECRRGMLRYVGPMTPKGVLRDVMLARYVAIR